MKRLPQKFAGFQATSITAAQIPFEEDRAGMD